MSPRTLLFRSLSYHRGIHLAVALGVAVGAAALTGALLVGDSVRGSLRDLTLDRLGAIDQALVTDRFVREELAEALPGRAAPAISIRAGAEAPDSGARASSVNLYGVDQRFWALFEQPDPELGAREILLNRSLARELGVEAGAAVVLRFQSDALVPSESVLGRKSDTVRQLRVTVKQVLDDRGAGRFGLAPSQQLPLNAYLALPTLARALEQRGRANSILLASEPGAEASRQADSALHQALTLEDLELTLAERSSPPALDLQTGRIVLEPATASAALEAAADEELAAAPVLTYLANSIALGDQDIPYSTVTALGEGAGELTLADGSTAAPLSGDQLYLNDWAARDLGAKPGDRIALRYYVVGPQGALAEESHDFELASVVRLSGLAADPNLAPNYKGMSDVDRMGDWDPPFPVDLSRVRDVDEKYWDDHRTAPKAFVAMETAKELWSSRFGQLSGVRIQPVSGRERFEKALLEKIDPAAYGLAFRPVKEQGLAAASGATDFSGLFIGFSLFLIVAAALLVALLFRLGVERRAREVGLLLANGFTVPQLRRLLVEEGALVTLAGCALGVPGAVAYAWLMVYGLRTWWSAAVGGSFLELHVAPLSLLDGTIGSFLLMGLSIWLAVRKLEKLSPRALLAGQAVEEVPVGATVGPGARRPRLIALGCFALAAALLAAGTQLQAAAQAGAFFGGAALLLVAALAWFRASLLKPSTRSLVGGSAPLWRLGVRNGSRFPSRSVLSAALVASASFVIVTVSLMRHDVSHQEPEKASGDGGFRYLAQSDLPLHADQLREVETPRIFPLRVKRGEDASCLNLYQPGSPTLLGAPQAVIERGGFAFQGTLAETEAEQANPWLLLDKEFPDGAVPVFGDANSVMWILHLGLGQTLEVDDGGGAKRKLIIAGLLSRSVFQSELILAEKRFLELYPDHSGYSMFLVDSPDPQAGVELEKRWADFGFDAQTTADRLAGYLVVENTYLSTFQTLGGLGLLLGVLGLAVVMTRNVLERRGELALLQAVGYGSRAIEKLVLAENVFLLLFGVGIGAGTAVLASAPHLLSGMAEPPWASLLLTLALIVATGLAAGAVAVSRSLRQPLLAGLRRE
ncbi:MAG: FtsX-like permease family protein [Acidobacteria bacterium]|nr:FtsX-like permease family protein [Acidobacteriota bacterium]